jgi:hypothetical protein
MVITRPWVGYTQITTIYIVTMTQSKKFANDGVGASGWFIWIQTSNPPQPVPLTLGCMPVMFAGPGGVIEDPIPDHIFLSNPRFPDPCPALQLPRMRFPAKEENYASHSIGAHRSMCEESFICPVGPCRTWVRGWSKVWNQITPGNCWRSNYVIPSLRGRLLEVIEEYDTSQADRSCTVSPN